MSIINLLCYLDSYYPVQSKMMEDLVIDILLHKSIATVKPHVKYTNRYVRMYVYHTMYSSSVNLCTHKYHISEPVWVCLCSQNV